MRTRATRDDDSGFAALQAVAIAVILGTLAAVVVAVLRGPYVDRFLRSCESRVADIRAATEQVRAMTSGYAENESGLLASASFPERTGALTSWPGDAHVVFLYAGDATTYHLAVIGPRLPGLVLDPGSTPAQVATACTRG